LSKRQIFIHPGCRKEGGGLDYLEEGGYLKDRLLSKSEVKVYGGIIIQDRISSYQYGEIGDDNSNFTVLYEKFEVLS
jgi:hypothetical protein